MRHRGVLLSIVGIALVWAAFKPEFRILAITLAFISKIGFFFLMLTTADYATELKQIAYVDVAATIMLVAVLGIHFYGK